MSKELYFFMTKIELIELSNKITSNIGVDFYKNVKYLSPEVTKYSSINEFEDLGVNHFGNHQSESYIVMQRETKLNLRSVKQKDGIDHYFIDQKENTDSIVFWPCGFYCETSLICGHIGTISVSQKSILIYHHFEKIIKQICKFKQGRYYYSEGVRKMNDIRLITMNINEPKEYDISLVLK